MSEARRRPTTEPGPVPRDSIDHVVSGWAASRPELDVAPVTIIARLLRANALARREVEAVLERHGLSSAEFSVLAVLARLGEASRERLAEELGLERGAVDERLGGLSERQLVKGDEEFVLTPEGLGLFEAVTPEHLENERRVLDALTPDEREALAILLRKLVVSLETGDDPSLT